MERPSLDFLKRYLSTISPSGFEDEAARLWAQEAETFADRVRVDVHGNVIAIVNEGGTPRVMLAGHTDEIGFMITYIDDDGYLYFTSIGGWDPQIIQGQRVWIRTTTGRVGGVIGKKPIHLLKDEARKQVVKVEDMWIDIGANGKQEAESLVAIGDPVVLAHEFEELRNGLVVSRGFDDKAGAFVVLEAARLLAGLAPQAEVHAVATVQEEVGLRGARTSAFGIDPQVGIAVEVTHATDYPSMGGEKKQIGEKKMGKGPVISRGANINPRLYELLVETARKREIPYQVEGEPRGTGTDANVIQLTRAGVATGLVSIPNRYMHTPCEVVSLEDLENTAKLLAFAVEWIDDETNFIPF
ncbi:MAG: M42 family metallopeptidase [Candidatus Bipolaricaulia bacterium]